MTDEEEKALFKHYKNLDDCCFNSNGQVTQLEIEDKFNAVYEMLLIDVQKQIATWTLKNFHLYDDNNNKYQENHEFYEMVRGIGKEMKIEKEIPDKDIDKIIEIIDLNGDGKIGLNEMKEANCFTFIHAMLYLFEAGDCPSFTEKLKVDRSYFRKIESFNKINSQFTTSNVKIDLTKDFQEITAKIFKDCNHKSLENSNTKKKPKERHEKKKSSVSINIKQQDSIESSPLNHFMRKSIDTAYTPFDSLINVKKFPVTSKFKEKRPSSKLSIGSKNSLEKKLYEHMDSFKIEAFLQQKLRVENLVTLQVKPDLLQKHKASKKNTKRINSKFVEDIYQIIMSDSKNNKFNEKYQNYFSDFKVLSNTIDGISTELEKVFNVAEKFCMFLIDTQNYMKDEQEKWKKINKTADKLDTEEIIRREMTFDINYKIEDFLEESDILNRLEAVFVTKPKQKRRDVYSSMSRKKHTMLNKSQNDKTIDELIRDHSQSKIPSSMGKYANPIISNSIVKLPKLRDNSFKQQITQMKSEEKNMKRYVNNEFNKNFESVMNSINTKVYNSIGSKDQAEDYFKQDMSKKLSNVLNVFSAGGEKQETVQAMPHVRLNNMMKMHINNNLETTKNLDGELLRFEKDKIFDLKSALGHKKNVSVTNIGKKICDISLISKKMDEKIHKRNYSMDRQSSKNIKDINLLEAPLNKNTNSRQLSPNKDNKGTFKGRINKPDPAKKKKIGMDQIFISKNIEQMKKGILISNPKFQLKMPTRSHHETEFHVASRSVSRKSFSKKSLSRQSRRSLHGSTSYSNKIIKKDIEFTGIENDQKIIARPRTGFYKHAQ